MAAVSCGEIRMTNKWVFDTIDKNKFSEGNKKGV